MWPKYRTLGYTHVYKLPRGSCSGHYGYFETLITCVYDILLQDISWTYKTVYDYLYSSQVFVTTMYSSEYLEN